MSKNTGHGHVVPRSDGVRARCGGPGFCKVCQAERAELEMTTHTPTTASQAEAVSISEDKRFTALTDAIYHTGFHQAGSGDREVKALADFFDAKLALARASGVKAADDFRELVSDSDAAEIKEWKARTTAAEAQLDAIREGIKLLQQYWVWDGHLCETQNQHPERAVVRLDKVLAILQQQPQADESDPPG